MTIDINGQSDYHPAQVVISRHRARTCRPNRGMPGAGRYFETKFHVRLHRWTGLRPDTPFGPVPIFLGEKWTCRRLRRAELFRRFSPLAFQPPTGPLPEQLFRKRRRANDRPGEARNHARHVVAAAEEVRDVPGVAGTGNILALRGRIQLVRRLPGILGGAEKGGLKNKYSSHPMYYSEVADAGYPIGSGAVEAANKVLVSTRLKRSGRC